MFAAVAKLSVDPYGFDVYELAYSELPELTTITRVLNPAERHTWIGSHHAVDEYATCFEFLDEAVLFFCIIGPRRRSQPKRCIVRECDCIINALDAKKQSDRTKHFFTISGRGHRDVCQNSGLVKIAR